MVVELGLITPPIGMNVFVIKGMAKSVPLETISPRRHAVHHRADHPDLRADRLCRNRLVATVDDGPVAAALLRLL